MKLSQAAACCHSLQTSKLWKHRSMHKYAKQMQPALVSVTDGAEVVVPTALPAITKLRLMKNVS